MDPLGSRMPAVLIGLSAGGGISIFAISAVIPMIVWACLRFRADRAAVPFVLWAVIGVGERTDFGALTRPSCRPLTSAGP